MSKQAILDSVAKDHIKGDRPDIRVGDVVRAHVKVREGGKERIQVFEGLVIAARNGGVAKNITVRKVASGVGVERTFPIHSPNIEKFEVLRHGKVRRAKLFYLRDKVGKAGRIEEKR